MAGTLTRGQVLAAIGAAGVGALTLAYLASPTLIHRSQATVAETKLESSNETFHWSTLTPSPRLDFRPCYGGHECARLQVPLDWNSSTDEDVVSLAILRLPAKVPLDDPRYGGAVIINPGGPGASGVDFVRPRSRDFQDLMDAADVPGPLAETTTTADERFFDILALDARGIMHSTPFHTCFTDPAELVAWEEAAKLMVPGDPAFPLEYMLAKSQAVSQRCFYDAVENPGGSKISSFMGTPAAARDLVELVEQYGEWREGHARQQGLDLTDPALEKLRYHQGEEPVQFWGLSYGTIVGATLAAAQPHRVRRMVLDGNIDPDDYYRGDWLHSVLDSDALMAKFFEYCAQAGPDRCAFNQGAESAEELLARYSEIEELLLDGPLVVPRDDDDKQDAITWSDLKSLVWSVTYLPFYKWATLADVLDGLSTGNVTPMVQWKATHTNKTLDKDNPCAVIDPHNPDCAVAGYNTREVWQAVQCADGDAEHITDATSDTFPRYLATLNNQSMFLGAPWSWIRFVCLGWRGRTAWKQDGASIRSAALAHPLLLLGNTRDSVTPLANAHAVAARFPGSRVLEVDIEGHCALSIASLCLVRAVRAYFQAGELPDEGARCLPLHRPLLGDEQARRAGLVEGLPAELGRRDAQLADVAERLCSGLR